MCWIGCRLNGSEVRILPRRAESKGAGLSRRCFQVQAGARNELGYNIARAGIKLEKFYFGTGGGWSFRVDVCYRP